MSAEAVGWVWRYSPAQNAALIVHLALADVANDMHDNELWSSIPTIQAKARLGRTTVIDALEWLVGERLLTLVEKRPGRTDLYRFEWPELPVRYSDRSPNRPVREPDPEVRDLDLTGTESAPELNRTQANNLAAVSQKTDDPYDIPWTEKERDDAQLAALRERFKA